MLACVVGLLPSLLYLAPVIAMVAFVVVAKIRGSGYDDEELSSGDTASLALLEHER